MAVIHHEPTAAPTSPSLRQAQSTYRQAHREAREEYRQARSEWRAALHEARRERREQCREAHREQKDKCAARRCWHGSDRDAHPGHHGFRHRRHRHHTCLVGKVVSLFSRRNSRNSKGDGGKEIVAELGEKHEEGTKSPEGFAELNGTTSQGRRVDAEGEHPPRYEAVLKETA